MIYIILLSLLSALFYRLGGWGNEGRVAFPHIPKWVFDTKARDIGCAIVCFISTIVIGVHAAWWVHLIAFLLLFGALTTYWDSVFGHDNFYMHGLMCGLAYFPYMFVCSPLLWGVRAFLLMLLMGFWSRVIGKDWLEEGGRGFLLPITLLLIGGV